MRNRPVAKFSAGSSPRVRGTDGQRGGRRPLARFIPAGAGNRCPRPWGASLSSAHPRGCGEQWLKGTFSAADTGSSPRVRGTEAVRIGRHERPRLIPAGAGNSRYPRNRRTTASAHPRGCGEQADRASRRRDQGGSSPRVRGTGNCRLDGWQMPRLIPAGAGNRPPEAARFMAATAHPRGCGEQELPSSPAISANGSSPRVRGTAGGAKYWRYQNRFIPAGAGNRPRTAPSGSNNPVHPRGCGEQTLFDSASSPPGGSSPRVRGTVIESQLHNPTGRFIPAGAGNRRWRPGCRAARSVHPRGCGEQWRKEKPRAGRGGSSPRVRGTDAAARRGYNRRRFIPAGAGNRSG